ncbi:transposase [Variovorax sp. YR752]|uniref:transposase n=1 Tax=Variovorax sp. YR752 TaxID=1884383 RepID=UPI000BE31E65|nr:transposase [Variovorax sp. YR752]
MNDRVTRGARGRREHSPELKRELVARSLLPGASVSAIALDAGINANLLFTWRRAQRNSAGQTPGAVNARAAAGIDRGAARSRCRRAHTGATGGPPRNRHDRDRHRRLSCAPSRCRR